MASIEASEHLADAMGRILRSMRSSSHRWERFATGMRRSDLTLLRWLGVHGESRPGDVADDLCLNASVISRQLVSLESEGLVERRGDPADGRAGLVRLTDLGVQRLGDVRRAYAAYLGSALGDWPDTKVHEAADLLLQLADRVARAADAEPDHA